MIKRIASVLTQRALDRRHPPPAVARWLARWHTASRRVVDELTAVDAALRGSASALQHDTADDTMAPAVLASHRDPAWWAGPAGWASAAAVVLLGLALWWLSAPEPTGDGATIADRGATTPTLNDDSTDPPMTANAALTRLDWPSFSMPQWPTPTLPVRLDEADLEATLTRGVNRLGSELERPLRQEWTRLVRDVSRVVGSVQSAWPRETDPAAPGQQSARPGPRHDWA